MCAPSERTATSQSDSTRLVQFLEHGAVAHFWPEDESGVFVSFDRQAHPGVDGMAELAYGTDAV